MCCRGGLHTASKPVELYLAVDGVEVPAQSNYMRGLARLCRLRRNGGSWQPCIVGSNAYDLTGLQYNGSDKVVTEDIIMVPSIIQVVLSVFHGRLRFVYREQHGECSRAPCSQLAYCSLSRPWALVSDPRTAQSSCCGSIPPLIEDV